MTQGLLLQGGAGSPLKLAAPGIDAGSASYTDLLFDANQAPLRRMQVAIVDVPIVQKPDTDRGFPFYVGPLIPLNIPPPPGKYNMFQLITQQFGQGITFNPFGASKIISNGSGNPFGGGQGGLARETAFQPIQFSRDTVGSSQTSATFWRFWALIFRNYQ